MQIEATRQPAIRMRRVAEPWAGACRGSPSGRGCAGLRTPPVRSASSSSLQAVAQERAPTDHPGQRARGGVGQSMGAEAQTRHGRRGEADLWAARAAGGVGGA